MSTDNRSQHEHPVAVSVSFHSATDLLITLWLVTERLAGQRFSALDLGPEWFEDIEADLADTTIADLRRVGSGEVWIALLALLPETGEGGTVADYIDFLEAYDPADLRSRLIQTHGLVQDEHRELVADAAEGQPGATSRLLSLPAFLSEHNQRWTNALRTLLDMSPEDTRELLVRTVAAVQSEAFASHETDFRPHLEADFHATRDLAGRLAPEQLIEIVTPGVSLAAEESSRPIVLMPNMVARPWVVFGEGAEFLVLGYPATDGLLDEDPDTPSAWLVKVHKALGDERRLKILRKLATRDASLAELSLDEDIAKSTLHHHLTILKEAGLIAVQAGNVRRYTLREQTLTEAASFLSDYVHHLPHTTESP